jgi:hypothetical protein
MPLRVAARGDGLLIQAYSNPSVQDDIARLHELGFGKKGTTPKGASGQVPSTPRHPLSQAQSHRFVKGT